MDKELLDFLNGDSNVAKINVIVSREATPNGFQFISIKETDSAEPLYSFWYNPKKEQKKENPPPKHTGGKKPYIMLMTSEIEKLYEKDVPGIDEALGCILHLGRYVEWGTGKLIDPRSKEPLKYKDLRDIFKYSNKKLNGLLKTMKDNSLLSSTDEGYFISTKLIKKGKAKEIKGET
ncbi:MAG: hypothetical protein Q8873_00595 [Bacillota bacterium]|nr:hypothetical protein [Bacillota bacterium]